MCSLNVVAIRGSELERECRDLVALDEPCALDCCAKMEELGERRKSSWSRECRSTLLERIHQIMPSLELGLGV